MFRGKQYKEKLKNGELVLSVMIRLADPSIVEMLAIQGIDLIMIDNEHYPCDPERMLEMVRAAHAGGAAVVVRLPNVEAGRIAQAMDFGMDGIMLPSVDNYEEAMELVNAMKFTPEGKRGFCPITRAACYGNGMTPAEFAARSNENSICILQIETKEGVEDLDRMLSIPQVDRLAYGPSDLSASYGCLGEYNNPLVLNAVETTKIKGGKKTTAGMFHTVEVITEAYADGARDLSIGSDQQLLMNGVKELVGAFRGWQSEHK